MKTKSKIILILLAFIALIVFMPNKVDAATYYNSEISYNEYSRYVEVVAAGTSITKVSSIPTTINGKPVTTLGDFRNCKDLTSISIPSSITKIDWDCFENCTSLKSITLPNSVTTINPYAFSGCTALQSITIPSSVTEMGRGVFEKCTSLKTVNLSSKLEYIPVEAFNGCTSLTSVSIPSSIKTIGWGAFSNCTSLSSITIPATVTKLNGNWYQEGIFANCTNLTTATINAKATNIPEGMFYGCTKLTNVTFSSSFTTMDSSVFENCTSLTSITLPPNLTNIGGGTFRSCKKLKTVNIPDSVTKVGSGAFYGCSSLVELVLPCGVREISGDYYYCFEGCTSLRTLYTTKTLQVIGNNAFNGLTASNITIYGYSGAAAKNYANSKGMKYVECKPITGITISGSSSVNYGETITLKANVTPSDSFYKFRDVKWTSSNTSIATVSSSGVVTGKGTGTVTIKATSRDGTAIVASKTITVKSGVPFTDIKVSAWYFGALKHLYSNKYVSGTTSTTFSPNQNISRAMLVTILWNMEGKPNVSGGSKFSDVTNTKAWYYKAIIWASSKGVVNGYKDGTFLPNKDITREETAAILMNYCKYKGKYKASTKSLSSYGDNNLVSPWAKTAVQWAVGNSVVNGTNNGTMLSPNATATRAEAITMIKNYIDKIK